MLLRCAVLLLYINVVRTFEVDGLSKNFVSDVDERYSLWPSIHNGVTLMRIHKREAVVVPPTTQKPDAQVGAQAGAQTLGVQGAESSAQIEAHTKTQVQAQSNAQSGAQSAQVGAQSKAQKDSPTNVQNGTPGGAQAAAQSPPQPLSQSNEQPHQQPPASSVPQAAPAPAKETNNKETGKPRDNNTVHKSENETSSVNATNVIDEKSKANNTETTEPPKINLSDPGVLKRAFIVFGGFALLAAAYYFIIYRKKGNNNDAKNTHSSIDTNQFRYGVLQSDEKRNMELSRVPLTMESDEDEDEDLEIFDLGQKKRSLSYINLEQHDEDIVLNDSRSIDMENLLVDIEDKNPDMINWSGNGSKSIL